VAIFLLPHALGMTAVFDKVLGHSCHLPELLCQPTDEIKSFGPKSTKRGTLKKIPATKSETLWKKMLIFCQSMSFYGFLRRKKKETNHKKILG
jgi:hypothetical protein